jgi:hypothetical protein
MITWKKIFSLQAFGKKIFGLPVMLVGGTIVILEKSFFKLATCWKQKDVSNMTA